MNVYLEYEGNPVAAKNLSWAIYSPCGCQSGVMVVQSGSFMVPNEEAAWKEFFDVAAIRKRERERGYSIKLMLHKDSTAGLGGTCDHSPKWGVPDETAPDGFAWGRKTKAKLLHLVPFDGDAEKPQFLSAKGGFDAVITARCGQEHWSWQVDPWARHDYLSCGKCVATIEATK